MRSPELGLIAAVAHSGGSDGRTVVKTLASALELMDHHRGEIYYDLAIAALPDLAQSLLEEMMRTRTDGNPYYSDFARGYYAKGKDEGKAEGKAEGEARAVLSFLDARGLNVADDARTRIANCVDVDLLDRWARLAATVSSVDELFD